MALDARHRTSIYQKLVPVLGDDDTNALMSEFPSVEADELVTKQFLRAELAELRGELRGEMADLRSELRGEMADLRSELRGEMAELRSELRGEMADIRGEIGELDTSLRGEIASLRVEIERKFNRQTVWLVGILVAGFSLLGIFR